MIPELGVFSLALALVASLVLAVAPFAGLALDRPRLVALARPAAQAQFAFVAVAFLALAHAFVTGDFSVAYVAQHSNTRLPLEYRIAAVWGGHEGSFLLWVAILSGWTLAVALRSRRLPEEVAARVLGVMGFVGAGFLGFLLAASNPFARVLPPSLEGRDLNPLLQDPGMVFHPPLLYMGYVGFSVAFAFAIASLAGGRVDAAWARWARPWTAFAWTCLTLGIALGSYWAYYELGWGGWWFWDPVENASFMPWLVGTALVHSLAVTARTGALRGWTVLLAIVAFSLSLVGTFLVRSGVLTSVHAFATDPRRGTFILVLLALVVGTSLVLFAVRAPRLAGGPPYAALSRESLILANNVLLVAAAAAVMLGTLYPLALDALGLGKISVGVPYFEAVFLPMIAPVLFLAGVGPLAAWRRASLADLARRLRWALGVSVAAAAVASLQSGTFRPWLACGLFLAAWIVAASCDWLARRLRGGGRPTAGEWGMFAAHLGVAVFVAGAGLSKSLETDREVRVAVGESVSLAGYAFRFAGVEEVQGPNYGAMRASFEVTREGAAVAVLRPEKRVYQAQRMPMTEAAIDAGVLRHLYVSLGEPLSANEWIVRIYHKPFIGWIWGGCLIMAFGALLSVAGARRHRAAQPDGTVAAAGPA